MASRAIWKAVIRCGDESVPVKMYSAVREQSVQFHLLHDQDLVRVKQRLANARTGRTVEYQQAQRGYQIESGVFVIVRPEEMDELTPPASRDIEIKSFVPSDHIHPQRYDRPYYLGPDGDEEAYFALARALSKQQKEGVAQWVVRKKRYVGSLRSEGDHLVLITMHHLRDIVTADELESPPGRKLDSKERRMAQQLVEALEDEFNPEDYHDEYQQRVRALIKAKQKGESYSVEEKEEAAPRGSLRDVLAASLKNVGKH